MYIPVPAFLGLGRLGLGLVLPTSLGFTVAGSFCAGAALAGGGRCCSWWVSRLRRLQILGPLLNSLAGTTGPSDGVDGVSAGILEAPVERFVPMSSSVVLVGGGLVLVVAAVCVVIAEGIIFGDLDIDDGSHGDILCADVLIFCVLSCALGVFDGSGGADFVTNDMVVGQRRLVGFFCYSFVFVADLAGVDLWSLVYQHEKSGWFSFPTAGGFPPTAWGGSSSGVPGLLVIEAPDPLLSGDVMAIDHLVRPVHSALIGHVGVPNVLFMVPLKISYILRREGGRLHGRQLRPSATGTTGKILQGLSCNLFYFQSCLCKLWDVNYQKFI